jgi:hypothetical protein
VEKLQPDPARTPATCASRALGGTPILLVIAAFGVWLRLDQIQDQIIADDEWHALYALRSLGFAGIFLHFGNADHCIPMSLLDKLLANTVGISELWMRAVPLLSGIAALVVLPVLVRPLVGAKTGVLFAALLAISPVHIYFSRYARPYAVVFLLGLVGALAFERFLATRKRSYAWAYVACAIVVPWFHPIFLPFALAPLAFAILHDIPRSADRIARIRELGPFAAAIVAGWMLLIGPPLWVDFDSLRSRSGTGTIDSETLRIGYDLVSGTVTPATRLAFAAACLIGLISWFARRRGLLAYLAFLVACQAAAVASSRPALLGISLTAVRYLFPMVGIALLLAAEGLSRIDELAHRASSGWSPRHLPSVLACLAFLGWSPLLSPFAPANETYFRPNSWTNGPLYQGAYARSDRRTFLHSLLPRSIPRFYFQLARLPAREGATTHRIVEAPWWVDTSAVPFVAYQRLHRWPTVVGFLHEPGEEAAWSELPWPDLRLRFRNFVNLADFEGLRARGVIYVVLHKNLAAEVSREVHEPPLPRLENTMVRYRERFGPPCFEDELITVFDLRSTP